MHSEVGYYVVGNVKGNGWNADDTQYKYEFGGASPYDNPEFSIRVPPAQDLTYGDHVEFKLLGLAHKGSWHTFKAYTPKVYLMGEASADGWGNRTAADIFSTPANRDGSFVSPALKSYKAVRIYVEIPETDWWKAEFGVAANKSIQYRGNSGSDGVSITRTAVVQYR